MGIIAIIKSLFTTLTAFFGWREKSVPLQEKKLELNTPVIAQQNEIKKDKGEFIECKLERKWYLKALFGRKWKRERKNYPVKTHKLDYREKENNQPLP